MDKASQANAASVAGLHVPRFARVSNSAELRRQIPRFRFPVVVKPVCPAVWRAEGVWGKVGGMKAILARDRWELEKSYRNVAPLTGTILVQEWIPGAESNHYVAGAYVSRRGDILGMFTARKIAQYPALFGLGCVVQTCDHPTVRRLATVFLQHIGFVGIGEIEFKYDPASGKFAFIEINPRHWDQHTLGTSVGVNLSYLMYQDLCTDATVGRVMPRRRRVTWINGGGLLGHVKESLASTNPAFLGTLAKLLGSRWVFSTFCWSDPRPLWRSLMATRFIRRFAHRRL